MADKKISELTAITNLSGDDLLLVVNDPSGSPTSNKITHKNFFANVVSNTVHKGVVTHKANTSFTGTTMTVTANLVYNGTNIGTKFSANSYLTSTFTTNTSFQSALANTNASVSDRMQVANTTLLVNDRYQVANAQADLANTNAYVATVDQRITDATASFVTQSVSVTTANGFVATKGSAPSSNNTATEGNLPVGTIFFSNNYLYIATDATTIKRVSLEVFS